MHSITPACIQTPGTMRLWAESRAVKGEGGSGAYLGDGPSLSPVRNHAVLEHAHRDAEQHEERS